MSRKSKKRKRTRQRRPRQRAPGALTSSEYRRNIRQADEILAKEGVEIRPDNWQQLALDWSTTPHAPERSELARYIADHESELGVPWAREFLRLEVFFQAEDYAQIIAHFDRALARYPRCALVEMWVADYVFRHAGDFWRARQMYCYAMDQVPEHGKSYYELGFMSHLLGDFSGALDWFNQAAERVADDDVEMGARIFYNRGMTRYLVHGDKGVAIADVKEALKRKPDYSLAQKALRSLRGRIRWVPW
jgi:tetratricopeptide (TPR) repeat protein